MALNMTIFSGSGSIDNEVEQLAASEVPEYTSYALLCVYLLTEHSSGNCSSITGYHYYSQGQETTE